MSKVIVLSQGLVAALLLSPVLGYCDNYLFPTNIVPQGKFDIQAIVGYTDDKQKNETNLAGLPFHVESHDKFTKELVSLRYGLTADTHIGISTSYAQYSSASKNLPDSAFQVNDTVHGHSAGNLNLFAKHRFYNEGETPFSLSAAANLEADTANNNYTALDFSLSAGWKFNEVLRAYATANTFLSDQDAIPDSQTLDVGFFKQITPNITLVPRYSYSHLEQAKNGNVLIASSRNYQYLGVSAQIEVMPNTYLIPAVGYYNLGGYHSGFNSKISDSFDEKSYALTFYHLF